MINLEKSFFFERKITLLILENKQEIIYFFDGFLRLKKVRTTILKTFR